MAQTKSLFAEIVDKYLVGIIGRLTEKFNDKSRPEQLLHLTMLEEEYSADLTWSSAEFQNNQIAADVVSMDSPLPLKKRDTVSHAVGKIPKLGIIFSRGEQFLSDVAVMSARGANEYEIATRILNDVGRAVNGINIRKEILFQQALSSGYCLVSDENDPSLGIRVNYGYLAENFFNVTAGRWGDASCKPLDDIEQLFDKANADNNSIGLVGISKAYFQKLRNSTQGKQLAAIFAGQVIVSLSDLMTPSRETMLNALQDEYGCPFMIVDSSFRIEGKNGENINIKPWVEANVVAMPSAQVGRLVYGTLAEETRPVTDVSYAKAGSHILVAEFGETNPLREFTSAQALALPVIDNVSGIYVLTADKKGKIIVDKESISEVAAGGSTTVTIDADSAVTASVPSTASWLTAVVAADSKSVVITCAANTAEGATERTSSVTLTDAEGKTKVIAVTQAA